MKRVRSKDFSEIINMLYHEIYSLRAKARLECGKCSQTADSKCIDMNFDMQKKASSIVVCPQKNYIKMLDLILTYSYKESGMEMDAYFKNRKERDGLLEKIAAIQASIRAMNDDIPIRRRISKKPVGKRGEKAPSAEETAKKRIARTSKDKEK